MVLFTKVYSFLFGMQKIIGVLWIILIAFSAATQPVSLHNINGSTSTDIALMSGKATVFFFLSPECPLCQSYSLTIRQLYNEYSNKNVTMIGVIPGTEYDNLAISTYKHKYQLPISLYKDTELKLVKKYHASITPEAVVVDNKGLVLYQGRIDNWAYELGKKRKVITEFDLKNALDQIIKSTPVNVSRTKAVGCFIE
jgi:peroxiredoxin